MEENKKDIAVEQSFDESPVVDSNQTMSVNGKEKKKKTGFVVALVLIGIAILGLGTFGVFKLLDFLNHPKTLFYSVVESTYSDFVSMMDNLKGNELYANYSSDTLETDSDLKIEFTGEGAEAYNALLKDISLSMATKIDKKNDYMDVSLKAMEDEKALLSAEFIDKNYKYYLHMPELFEKIIELDMDRIDVETFNAEKNIYIGDIIKSELLKSLDEERFEASIESVAIKGKIIECNKNTYTFKGNEIKDLLDNIIASIVGNKDVNEYVANLLSVKVDDLEESLKAKKDELKIEDDFEYVVAAYTEKTTDRSVRFEVKYKYIDEEDNETDAVFTYDKEVDYKELKMVLGEKISSIEIDGNLKGEFDLKLVENKSTFSIKGKNNNSSLDASFEYKNSDEEDSFTGTIKNTNKKESNGSSKIDTELTLNSAGSGIKLNMTTSIKTGVTIEQADVKNSIKVDEMTEADKTSIMTKLMSILMPGLMSDPSISGSLTSGLNV